MARRRLLDGRAGGRLQQFDIAPENLIQSPDVNRILSRALNLKERVPAPVLAPEIMPVITVGFPAERHVDESGVSRWYCSQLDQSGLGGFARFSLRIPQRPEGTTRVLVRPQWAQFSNPAGPLEALLGFFIVPLFVDNVGEWQLNRFKVPVGGGSAIANVGTGTDAGATPTNLAFARYRALQGHVITVDLRGIILFNHDDQDTFMSIKTDIVNSGLCLSMCWAEEDFVS